MKVVGTLERESDGESAFPAIVSQVVYMVLFVGQSNVPGRNTLDGSETTDPDHYQWGGNSGNAATYRQLTNTSAQMYYPSFDPRGGPDRPFCDRLRALNPSAKTVAVNLAIGSTAVHNGPWAVGGSHYNTTLTQAEACRTAILAEWPGATIIPIIWMGTGEQDASNGVSRPDHLSSLAASLAGMRANITGFTNAQVILPTMLPRRHAIGGANYTPASAAIDAAQDEYAAGDALCQRIYGPDESVDSLHYQGLSAVSTLGVRAADALYDNTGPTIVSASSASVAVGGALSVALAGSEIYQTFEIVGGANQALFTITDPFVDPRIQWSGATPAVGSYVVEIAAKDGSGNQGATFTFTATVSAMVQPSTFFNGDTGGVYRPSDISTLWQDDARTIQVTQSGDPVRVIDDVSGNGNHLRAPSDAARPIYIVDAQGKGLLRSNGTSAVMQADAIWTLAPGTIWTAVAAQKAAAQSGESTLLGQYGSNAVNFLDMMQSANASTNVRINGRFNSSGLGATPNVGPFYDDTKRVASSQLTDSQGVAQIRDASTTPVWGDSDGVGTLNQGAAFGSASVFARRYSSGTTNTYWAGDLYDFFIIGKVLTEQQIADGEVWAYDSMGIAA